MVFHELLELLEDEKELSSESFDFSSSFTMTPPPLWSSPIAMSLFIILDI